MDRADEHGLTVSMSTAVTHATPDVALTARGPGRTAYDH
jgi:hypothetical protein